MIHGRAPEETVLDLPPVVPAGPASRKPTTCLREGGMSDVATTEDASELAATDRLQTENHIAFNEIIVWSGTETTASPIAWTNARRKHPRQNRCDYPLPWTNFPGRSRKTSSARKALISLALWEH